MPFVSEILEARTSQSRSSSKRNRKNRSSSKNNNWTKNRNKECHEDKNVQEKVTLIGFQYIIKSKQFLLIRSFSFDVTFV